MKFKEMSWEELKKDFKKVLDSFTTQELIDSLKPYEINSTDYCFKTYDKNNLNEICGLNEIDIMSNEYKKEYLKDENYILEIKNNEYKRMEEAA